MKALPWFRESVSLALCMTGCGMCAFLIATHFSEAVRQWGYGDDWLINTNPLAAVVVLVATFRWRKQWWLGAIGLVLTGWFLWECRVGYLAASEMPRGLASAFGRAIWMILAYATGVSFLVYVAVAAMAIGCVRFLTARKNKTLTPGAIKI